MDKVQDAQVSREAMDGRSDSNRYAGMEVGGRQCLEQAVDDYTDEVQDVQVSREAMDGRSDRNRYADMEVGGRQCLEQIVETASGTSSRRLQGRNR
jgi:hypothetical protein